MLRRCKTFKFMPDSFVPESFKNKKLYSFVTSETKKFVIFVLDTGVNG